MIWIIPAAVAVLALTAAGLARAAVRAGTHPQPSHGPIPAGDIGVAALACRPGWRHAYILDAYVDAGGHLIIVTAGPDGAKTGLIIPSDVPAALASVSSLLALDTPLDARSLASAITASRAGTVIAIRITEEDLS